MTLYEYLGGPGDARGEGALDQLCLSYVWGHAAVARPKTPFQARISAFDFGVAIDNALKLLHGRGLAAFLADPERPVSDDTTVLSMSMGQGSIGMSVMWSAVNKVRLMILPLWDPSHRLWNDTKLAISDAGLWPFVLLHLVLLNCWHGPWNGSAFWEQTVDASRL